MKLTQLKKDLERYQRTLNVQVAVIAEKNESFLTDLNTEKQLFDKGIRSDGSNVEPPYTQVTKSIKRRKGQPVDRVTLKDKGSFYDRFKIDANQKRILFTSTDEKTDSLVNKYGRNIFGLTNENTAVFARKIVLPQLQRNLRKAIQ